MNYPTKTKEFGDYAITFDRPDSNNFQHCKGMLAKQYEYTKIALERDDPQVFCHVHDFEWIIKPTSGDPFNQQTSIGWKCKATGRAFYMDRLGHYGKIYKRHPDKKGVPKRKRGKFDFKRFTMGMISPSNPDRAQHINERCK